MQNPSRDIKDLYDETAALAVGWLQLGVKARKSSDYAESRARLEKALDLIANYSDDTSQKIMASAKYNIALIDIQQDNYLAARKNISEAYGIWQRLKDERGISAAEHELGTICLYKGEYDEAKKRFNKALSIRESIGDDAGISATWHNLATIDLMQGKYEKARKKFKKSLAIKRIIGDREGEMASLNNLAHIDLRMGQLSSARSRFEKLLDLKQMSGEKAGLACVWHNLATIDLTEDKFLSAWAKSNQALELRRSLGDRGGEASTLRQMAKIDVCLHNRFSAWSKLKKSLEIFEDIGDAWEEAETLHQLALIEWREGNKKSALNKLYRALATRERLQDQEGIASTLHQIALINMETGSYPEAMKGFRSALQLKQRSCNLEYEVDIWKHLSDLASRWGEKNEAWMMKAFRFLIHASPHWDDLRSLPFEHKEILKEVINILKQFRFSMAELQMHGGLRNISYFQIKEQGANHIAVHRMKESPQEKLFKSELEELMDDCFLIYREQAMLMKNDKSKLHRDFTPVSLSSGPQEDEVQYFLNQLKWASRDYRKDRGKRVILAAFGSERT